MFAKFTANTLFLSAVTAAIQGYDLWAWVALVLGSLALWMDVLWSGESRTYRGLPMAVKTAHHRIYTNARIRSSLGNEIVFHEGTVIYSGWSGRLRVTKGSDLEFYVLDMQGKLVFPA